MADGLRRSRGYRPGLRTLSQGDLPCVSIVQLLGRNDDSPRFRRVFQSASCRPQVSGHTDDPTFSPTESRAAARRRTWESSSDSNGNLGPAETISSIAKSHCFHALCVLCQKARTRTAMNCPSCACAHSKTPSWTGAGAVDELLQTERTSTGRDRGSPQALREPIGRPLAMEWTPPTPGATICRVRRTHTGCVWDTTGGDPWARW